MAHGEVCARTTYYHWVHFSFPESSDELFSPGNQHRLLHEYDSCGCHRLRARVIENDVTVRELDTGWLPYDCVAQLEINKYSLYEAITEYHGEERCALISPITYKTSGL
jgi:hypothetical protein